MKSDVKLELSKLKKQMYVLQHELMHERIRRELLTTHVKSLDRTVMEHSERLILCGN